MIAMIDDGWCVHNLIIWNKAESFNDDRAGSCMVESVRGRMTHGYEFIIFASPEGRPAYDWFEAREIAVYPGDNRHLRPDKSKEVGGPREDGGSRRRTGNPTSGRNWRDVWTLKRSPSVEYCQACDALYLSRDYARLETVDTGQVRKDGKPVMAQRCNCGRHDAWLAHYATFPLDLPYRAIQAGTMPYVCSVCGKPWERMVAESQSPHDGNTETPYPNGSTARRLALARQSARENGCEYTKQIRTTGWRSTCGHPCRAPGRAVVLDPFAGTGTTLVAARLLGRDSIGIEPSAGYAAMMRRRLREDVGFERVVPRLKHGRKQQELFAVTTERGDE